MRTEAVSSITPSFSHLGIISAFGSTSLPVMGWNGKVVLARQLLWTESTTRRRADSMYVCVCVNSSSSRYKEGSGVVRMHTIFTCGIGFHGSRKMLAGKPSESLTAMAMAPSVRRSPWLSGTRRSSFAEWILSHPKSAAAGCSTNPSDFGIISKRDSEPTVRNSFDT